MPQDKQANRGCGWGRILLAKVRVGEAWSRVSALSCLLWLHKGLCEFILLPCPLQTRMALFLAVLGLESSVNPVSDIGLLEDFKLSGYRGFFNDVFPGKRFDQKIVAVFGLIQWASGSELQT